MQPKKRKIFRRAVATKCSFCEKRSVPSYRDVEGLDGFLTERGKLLGRARTGLCQKHQRRLAIEVKRARLLARMAYVAKLG